VRKSPIVKVKVNDICGLLRKEQIAEIGDQNVRSDPLLRQSSRISLAWARVSPIGFCMSRPLPLGK
jgi:hypothetical protein